MLGQSNVCAVVAVKDLQAAAKFYGKTLDLSSDIESPGGTFYTSGNSGIFVYPSEYAGTNKATAAAWTVDDVDGTAEALKAKGVSFERYEMPGVTLEGDVHVMGKIRSAWFKDPDGNILNIVNQVG